MLSWPPTVKIFLGAEPTDMRKGFDSLAYLVESSMGLDPLSGSENEPISGASFDHETKNLDPSNHVHAAQLS